MGLISNPILWRKMENIPERMALKDLEVVVVAVYSDISTFSVCRPLKPFLGTATWVTRV